MTHRLHFFLFVAVAMLVPASGCKTGSKMRLPPVEIDAGPPGVDARVDAFVPVDSGPPMCGATEMICAGTCVDPQTSSAHCGGCGMACAAGDECSAGECVLACPDGQDPCDVDMVPTCVDLQTDTSNCGRCGTRCAPGIMCTDGRCACPAGLRACGGVCVDVMTDVDNCGTCASGCGTGGTCEAGVCTMCGTDRTACAGRCIDTATDPRNCGSCARACDPGESCTMGLCSCVAPRTDCGGGCSDLMTDPMHCGDCLTDCGAGGVCMAGTCMCAFGLTMCGASCANLMTDALNCGMCGMACPMGEVCVMGGCTDAPPIRYMQTAPTAAMVPFVDVCAMPGHMEFFAGADDDATSVMLPFAFRYWARDLPAGSPINIATNGWIGMDGVDDASLYGAPPPDPETPNAVIAPHWTDTYMRGPLCVATVGTAPLRQWIVQWNDALYCCGGPGDPTHLTYEIILTEGSATIDFVYQTMTAARDATMGIEDHTAMMGINACPGGTDGCTPTSGQRVRFVPIP